MRKFHLAFSGNFVYLLSKIEAAAAQVLSLLFGESTKGFLNKYMDG